MENNEKPAILRWKLFNRDSCFVAIHLAESHRGFISVDLIILIIIHAVSFPRLSGKRITGINSWGEMTRIKI